MTLNEYQSLIAPILQTVITVAIPVIGTYIMKYLNSKVGVQATQMLISDAAVIVRSVEQLAASGQIPPTSKFLYALNMLRKLYPEADTAFLSHQIEAQVHAMKVQNEELSVAPQQNFDGRETI
jgi:hypothetical protein